MRHIKRGTRFPHLAADLASVRRTQKEPEHEYRTPFMRDRDRILYSKAFRRLSGKTQIFVTNYDDHARTRLTHTLEVAQIARTICRQWALDEDLAEAIALGHDLGHTPFGHVGERVLNHLMNGCFEYAHMEPSAERGFKHNLQGLRVCEDLESGHEDYGLNLTHTTLYGILAHTGRDWGKKSSCDFKCSDQHGHRCNMPLLNKSCMNATGLIVPFYDRYVHTISGPSRSSWSIEAHIVAYADEIAQRHHDLEDGLVAGLIAKDEVRGWLTKLSKRPTGIQKVDQSLRTSDDAFRSEVSRYVVGLLVDDLVKTSTVLLKTFCTEEAISTAEDLRHVLSQMGSRSLRQPIGFSTEVHEWQDNVGKFLRERILQSHEVQLMDGRATYVIRKIFEAYMTNPQQLSDKTMLRLHRNANMPNPAKKSEVNSEEIASVRSEIKRMRNGPSPHFRSALARTVCDYISGMTDAYAMAEYRRLYGVTDDFRH